MPRDPIPESLRRFILTSVTSVPFVEALLIFRDAKGAPVETEDVARRLYIPLHATVAVVGELANARLVEGSGGAHRYHPTEELAGLVDQLAAYYRSHLVEVTDLIHAKTARQAQRFADAFRWRKD